MHAVYRHRTRLFCGLLGIWILVGASVAPAATPTFVDSGQVFGTTKGHKGRCNAWADLTGNGLYDVITGGHDDGLLAYFQESPLMFRRVDAEIGLAQLDEPLYGILLLDFDRDGDKDMVLNQVGFGEVDGTPSLRYLRNNGSGRFGERTIEVGFSQVDRGFGLAALDFDKDGWLDIYVVNHRSANALYRNRGDGSFEDVTAAAGVGGQYGRLGDSTGIATLDYDRDGWTDIFVTQRDDLDASHPFGNNLLYHNQGDGTFVNRAVEAGVDGFSHDFVASAGDIDNNGWPDLHVATFNFGPNGFPETNYRNRTYLNQGDGTFLDVSLGGGADYIGGTMGLALDDADNDGNVDIYIGTGGPFDLQVEDQMFYMGLGDGSFVERTSLSGLTSDARGHGSTWLDIDRDGDLDLFASLGGHTPGSEHRDVLYLNQGPTENYLEVAAHGVDCPLEGIGVVAECFANGGSWRREIRATGGFDSMRPPVAWFGLGATAHVDSLVLQWPCGRRQVLYDVAVNDHLEVVEPSTQVPVLDFELLTRRDDRGGVSLTVGPIDDALPFDRIHIERRAENRPWIELRLDWARDGDRLLARDPAASPDRGWSYRVLLQIGDRDTWIQKESFLAGSRFALRAEGSPFVGGLRLSAVAVSAESTELRIFDLRGRQIRRMAAKDATIDGNTTSWWWDGRDQSGRPVPRGAYVVELRSGGRRAQRSIYRIAR